jgi:K+-transporting ATPase ATPase A chain
VLLPIAIVGALFLVSQGVVQNLKPYDGRRRPIEGAKQTHRARAGRRRRRIIKQFGTNGGGFFNANSAHPFENPTPLSNFLAMFGIFAISSGLTYTLGSMTGSPKHGWAVWAAMAFLFSPASRRYWAEARGNPLLTAAGADQTVTASQPAATWKARRSGSASPTRRSSPPRPPTRAAAPINGWHDSFTPLGGLVPLANIQLSEVVFGGVGAGMYGVLVYIILAVFIAGLMVGRTPEYLGKKIQAFEVQMAMLTVLIFSLLILTFTAISSCRRTSARRASSIPARTGCPRCSTPTRRRPPTTVGVRRHQRQHQVVQHHARPDDAVRRFFMIIPPLAIAGSLSRKKLIPRRSARFPSPRRSSRRCWSA